MTAIAIEDMYELSPMQRGMLFHTLYAPHSGIYIDQLIYQIDGQLEPALLHKAWQQVVWRHAPLRTAFLWEELDNPLQVVYRDVPLPWELHDWRDLSTPAHHDRLETLLAADRQRGFDLMKPPLMHLKLLRLSDERHYLVWCHHHLLLDGWSAAIVLQEVFLIYRSLQTGEAPELPQRLPFRDYITWLQKQDTHAVETFWRAYLQGVSAPTPLLIESPGRDEEASSASTVSKAEASQEARLRGGRPVRLHGFRLADGQLSALRLFTRQHQLTLNTVIQGAWALLLSRYSGERDIIFGATVAGRPMQLSGAERMIGIFINTLPVRVQLPPQAKIVLWLKHLQEQQAEAHQYDHSPLVQVQGCSEIPRDQPLFESLLVFENYPLENQQRPPRPSRLRVSFVQSLEQTNYPLVLVVTPGEQVLHVDIGYETARFSEAAIMQMLKHLSTLLTAITRSPEMRLADISLLNAEEKRQLLTTWNEMGNALHEQKTPALSVIEAFQDRVAQAPDRIALVCSHHHLTYEELDQRSNQLAHELILLGVKREIAVGVCLERSLELPIALLSIFKANGIYLPLDPGYPSQRLAQMLAEAQATVILTRTPHLLLFKDFAVKTLCLDAANAVFITGRVRASRAGASSSGGDRAGASPAPTAKPLPAQAAYIMYTSGSTGGPKGVVVPHYALLNHIKAISVAYALNEQDRVLQFASANFDVALEELLPSWIQGACVDIVSETPAPSVLTHLIDREGLSVINLPSSYWHEWIAETARRAGTSPASLSRRSTPHSQLATLRPPEIKAPTVGSTESLRLVIIGSEQASAARLSVWQRLMSERVTLCNAYGLTETTITSLVAIPGPIVTQNEKRPLPVGRPLANIQAYVLDERLQPVPMGMPGELYIGGAGLARGYLGNPALTAERFIPHPFDTLPGARLYRSGDRARYLPSGEFEVLGRSDAQIKIRGFRIEPGEIEARLLQHPAVHEALVLVYEENLAIPPANAAGRDQSGPYEGQAGGKEAPGDPRLAAYVVIREQEPSLMNKLRHFLQETLPPYMVPTLLIPLETLPRTATGKIDRRAFPTPQQKLMQAGDYIAPRTPVEEIVAGIWSEVLHLERTGRTDHFFKLGGHSLQATQVIARLREIMRIELPVRAVYDAPTVAALAARIEQERQRALETSFLPLQAVSRDTPLPLSFAQQRLWFLDQMQPESPFYNIAVAFHARGTLNVCALEASVYELLRRHEILRTTFALDGEQPVQVIAPMLSLPLPIIQLGTERDEPGCFLGEDECRALITRLCNEEARRPFDLRTGPLIRVSILRLSKQEHVLLLTLHHIVADGWSVDIFLQELSVLYRGRVQGQPVTLPPLAIQYADYAIWQRYWLQGEILERQLAYWRQQLDNAPTLLELPTDRPRPAIQTYNGACHTFLLPLALLQRLRLLSRGEGVTLFMALLAGIQALLFRYTGQTDIVVGTPAGGRIQRETEGLIGLFLNTLVLRTQVSGDLTYHRLLERVRNVALEAYMHQDLPFEKLVDEMHIERSLSHTPLFQILLTLQQATVSPVDLYGLRLESLLSTTATAKFDLSFELFETSSGLYGLLTYNTDLFDGTTIERMVGHLQTLLEDCVARPDIALIELNLLTRAEQQQLLVGGQPQGIAPTFEAQVEQGIAPTFEAQVERTPDAVALVWEQEQLTYQELNARANQLAHHLRLSGVASEVRVGIYLERSIELVIAVLGILKAGGAYLPLDLDYPRERLAFMLQNAQVPILLTQEHLLDALPAVDSIICLKRDWTIIARQSWQNPVVVTQIQNTAYIIYTSGSTGKPKGVMVSHINVMRLFKTSETIFHFTEHDIWTLFHSTAFDFSVWELWGALLYGGRLVMVPYWVSRSPQAFSELLCQQAVTVLNQTPSAFRQLIQFEEGQATEQSFSLRLVVFGGEALDFASLRPWFERHGDQSPRLVNMYGITETTVHATYFAVTQTNLTAGSMIGRPLADLQMYVLDTRLRPAPIGVPGEIYVGGSGLARGYLNRPELTAERFIPHPFVGILTMNRGGTSTSEPGARLYRTGDLARFRPDGSLEYLGRIDQQVKLHGFRIELEEIERALRQHPAVKDALVGLQSVNGQQNQDQQHLVAYVVTPPQHEVASSSELRSYLQAYLPNYMLPALFISLEALPLSPNGKIDRKRLPVPDQEQRPELDASFVAPGTEIERLLATIWAEVLGLERVGIHDRFFELGGDSIQVIQVTARARKAHLHLTPRQMFQHQTIAELVTVVQAPPAFTLEQSEVKGPVPLTPIQRWFFEQNQPETHYYNQAMFLETERLPISLLVKALNYLLCHHDALRMRFTQKQDGWQQQNASIDEAGPVPFLHIDCVGLPLLAQRKVIAQTSSELQAGLHLEKGPLLRVASFDLGTTQRILLIAHHLIIDGVSWSILLEDLDMAYQQLSHGEEIHLPPKTSSFQQWAQGLLAYANSPAQKQEATNWLTISRTPITTLPVDRSSFQEVVTEASTQRIVGRLSQEETRALLQEVLKAYHTQINDVLLAALAETLREWTNGQAFLVDLEGHGREHMLPDIDLSRTVGWFTTIFPVLLNLAGQNKPGEVLVTIKEQLRSTPNHGIGYGLLRYLQPDPAIATQLLALPQAELSFNYLGQIDRISQEPAFFRPASELIGPNFSPQTRRTYKLDILASISAGQLQVAWIYSDQLYERATLEYLAQRYIQALRRLIDHCLSPDAGGYTPSDFPAAQIDARALSKVAQLLEEDEEL
ncbi:MAG TPA: amino acid adenylation domain-containing protein [Ktedonobacteraceae bacterium]|nr:amino acid adenylation domain-containing protein [Ktedonobacteraceae bacterium]